VHGSFGEQREDRGADVAPPTASTAAAVMAWAEAGTEARTARAKARAAGATRAEAGERRTEAAAAAHAPTVFARLMAALVLVVLVMVVIHDHSSYGLFLDVSTIYR
jgi:hypothetical protein